MSYAYSYETNSVSKWDTIQADVSDAYTHIDEELAYTAMINDEQDVFGFTKAISLDHLTDEQLDEIAIMLGVE
jgi:hypothetical protein